MAIKKSDSIILSVSHSGEGDIIAKALTSDSGKKIFIFKGLKKSRKRPQIEPGLRLEIIYYHDPKKNSHTVKEFSINSKIDNIRKNLDTIYHMMYMLESAEKTVPFDEKVSGLFQLLYSGIDALGSGNDPELVSAFYTVRLLKILGILYDFNSCTICGKKLETFSINAVSSGPKCIECSAAGEKTFCSIEREFILHSSSRKFRDINLPAELNERIKPLHNELVSHLERYCGLKIKCGKLICKNI